MLMTLTKVIMIITMTKMKRNNGHYGIIMMVTCP